jgi:DNA-binding response OmpR family regulator
MKTNKIKVLLLEDSRLQAQVAIEELKRLGAFEVEWAEALSGAMDYLKKNRVDVVVTDLHLSDSHGLETFTRLHACSPDVPIVILTGTYEEEELALQALKLGAQDYVMKSSMEGDMLRRILHYAIERKRQAEDLRRAYDDLEKKVRERTAELEAKVSELQKFKDVTVNRESRMIELKKEVNALLRELGRPELYDVSFGKS